MLKLKYSDYKIECGTDEAGRGCLAGPVTAAVVIFENNYTNNEINDMEIDTKIIKYFRLSACCAKC